jgi:hypothetical protein
MWICIRISHSHSDNTTSDTSTSISKITTKFRELNSLFYQIKYPVVLLSGKPPLPPSSLMACKTTVRLAIDRVALYKLISGSLNSITTTPLSLTVKLPRSPICR